MVDVTNVTDLVGMLGYMDSALTTSGVRVLGIGILVLIFFVSFLASKVVSAERSLVFSSFLTMISAIILRTMDLVADGTLFICVILFVISFAYLFVERDNETI